MTRKKHLDSDVLLIEIDYLISDTEEKYEILKQERKGDYTKTLDFMYTAGYLAGLRSVRAKIAGKVRAS